MIGGVLLVALLMGIETGVAVMIRIWRSPSERRDRLVRRLGLACGLRAAGLAEQTGSAHEPSKVDLDAPPAELAEIRNIDSTAADRRIANHKHAA